MFPFWWREAGVDSVIYGHTWVQAAGDPDISTHEFPPYRGSWQPQDRRIEMLEKV